MIGPADVLLAISVKPYTRQTVQAARYAKKRGARVIAVTDSEVSPLAAISTKNPDRANRNPLVLSHHGARLRRD
jgi:DNA-binding MurR/RpiR family transcriptional regulator